MIAIIGQPGVGKTTLLNKLNARGFKTLEADIFFKQSYIAENECYKLIKSKLGQKFVNDKEVDLKVLREYIKSPQNLDTLEKVVHPVLEKHLKQNKYDFVEIPIIGSKHANFKGLFKTVAKLVDKKDRSLKNLQKRVVDNSQIELITSLYKDYQASGIVEISVHEAQNIDIFLRKIA